MCNFFSFVSDGTGKVFYANVELRKTIMEEPDSHSMLAKEWRGESVAEVAARMTAAADEIAAHHPQGRVMLVSHGLAVSTLYCQANQIPLTQVYQYIPENAVPLTVKWKSAA